MGIPAILSLLGRKEKWEGGEREAGKEEERKKEREKEKKSEKDGKKERIMNSLKRNAEQEEMGHINDK
jgi:hypothetical protein